MKRLGDLQAGYLAHFAQNIPQRQFVGSVCFSAFLEFVKKYFGVLAEVRYNSFLRRSGGTADAAVSKTVVERRAGSNPASGTS